jgi:hypothetical protein
MSKNTQEFDRNALFLQALQERMAQMVVEYETKYAELRVEYTLLTSANETLTNRIQELEGNNVPKAVEEAPPAE